MNNIQQFLEEEKEKVRNAYFYKADDFDVMLKDHDTRLINFILSEVEREVGISMAEHNETRHGSTLDDAYARVSTIINNLRVKLD